MKLKYYLRGLGIGIIVTVIILTITNWGLKKPLTDAQIIERAKELGMIQPGEEDTEQENGEQNGLPGTDAENEASSNGEETDKAPEESTPEEPKEEDDTQKPEENEPDNQGAEEAMTQSEQSQPPEPSYVEINVAPGEFSDRISQKLFEAGLVADAAEFNSYLTGNGIDGLIIVGVHQIPQGAAYEEIARILCENPKE